MMSYATIGQLRDYLAQVQPGAARDAELQAVLERAHQVARRLVGIVFAAWPPTASPLDVECAHSGRWLETPPYLAGSILTVQTLRGRGTAGATVTPVTGWLSEADGRLYLDRGWTPGWYRIEARWGYGPPPADAVQLDLQIAVNIWRARDAANFSQVVGAEGEGAVQYNRAVTWSERELAARIREEHMGRAHA